MRNVLGAGMLGCGVLMAAVFGLMTLIMVAVLFTAWGSISMAAGIVASCAVPCALGVGLVWLGRRQIRRADEDARDRVQSDVFD